MPSAAPAHGMITPSLASSAAAIGSAKSLRVLLLSALVGAFILYLSEMRATQQSPQQRWQSSAWQQSSPDDPPWMHRTRALLVRLEKFALEGSGAADGAAAAAAAGGGGAWGAEGGLPGAGVGGSGSKGVKGQALQLQLLRRELISLHDAVAALAQAQLLEQQGGSSLQPGASANGGTAGSASGGAGSFAEKLVACHRELMVCQQGGSGSSGSSGTESSIAGAAAAVWTDSTALKVENEELKRKLLLAEGKAAVPTAVLPSEAQKSSSSSGSSATEEQLRRELSEFKTLYERAEVEKKQLAKKVADLSAQSGGGTVATMTVDSAAVLEAAKKALKDCGRAQAAPAVTGQGLAKSFGSTCTATDDELKQYLAYTPRAPCPDDWYHTQELLFVRSCFCLPRRRCFARSPPAYKEPSLTLPQSLFDQRALDDSRVLWDGPVGQYWPNYKGINSRKLGDCRDCFNLTLEAHRWRHVYRGTIPMEEMLKLKPPGSIRIGLDAGGGTGSFAAHMQRFNVTIVTTAINTETLGDRMAGLPYMETIAQRGLVPLHVPHAARLPFFDNTLDIIHAINSIKYFTVPQFEELMFEWDRVLRPGGVLWFELFYAPVEEMPLYIAVLDLFGYKKLYWTTAEKTDVAERMGKHIYLNTVLEKPRRPSMKHDVKPAAAAAQKPKEQKQGQQQPQQQASQQQEQSSGRKSVAAPAPAAAATKAAPAANAASAA